MAHQVMIPGCPTFHVAELRQRADRLLISGHREEGSLLHGLLDGYLEGLAADPDGDLADEKWELEEALAASESEADKLRDRVDDLTSAATAAVEKLKKALGKLRSEKHAEAKAAIADAISELIAETAE